MLLSPNKKFQINDLQPMKVALKVGTTSKQCTPKTAVGNCIPTQFLIRIQKQLPIPPPSAVKLYAIELTMVLKQTSRSLTLNHLTICSRTKIISLITNHKKLRLRLRIWGNNDWSWSRHSLWISKRSSFFFQQCITRT